MLVLIPPCYEHGYPARKEVMNSKRYYSVILLMGFGFFMLQVHRAADVIPPGKPLSQVPNTIAGWTGTDISLDQETLDILGNGEFLDRMYTRPGGNLAINLFIAYFPSQRAGSAVHSPKHCLPGAGWYFVSSKYVNLKDDSGKVHQVGEYVVSNGDSSEFVIYWFLAHGRSVASEYRASYYLVKDAMLMNRTDGSLIRVITPIGSTESTALAQARAEAFTKTLTPMLPRYIPN